MDLDWTCLRTALAVARAGTISGAARRLGIHHASVIRHVDTLEAQLGAKLFQRHPRGYTLTEAGAILRDFGTEAEARLTQMAARLRDTDERLSGPLIVTAPPSQSALILPALVALNRRHPGLMIRYDTGARLARLDLAEAHVALRAGARPDDPDHVVAPYAPLRTALYGAPDYLARHGVFDDPARHRFVLPGPEGDRTPMMRWLSGRIGEGNRAFVSNDAEARLGAVRAGLGLGFMTADQAEGLVEVLALPDWFSTLWVVTHVDLHRSPKVQAALAALRETAPAFPVSPAGAPWHPDPTGGDPP